MPRHAGRRRRDGRATRIPAAAVLPPRAVAGGAGPAHLRSDPRRFRRDVPVRRPDRARGPLGHRRLRARAAEERGFRREARGARHEMNNLLVSYLAAWLFVLALSLGSMANLMV